MTSSEQASMERATAEVDADVAAALETLKANPDFRFKPKKRVETTAV
jgi:hypothetical protein